MTQEELKIKRDEFWCTQPSYSGRKEAWEALQATCDADSTELGQAILESAGLSLPNGTLQSVWDTLGNHYVVPLYCYTEPTNMISHNGPKRPASEKSVEGDTFAATDTPITITFRLSTQKDVKESVRPSTKIGEIRQRMLDAEYMDGEWKLRFLYLGRLLDDKVKISEISNLTERSIVQVLASPVVAE